jgi:hypothetical protein
MNKAQRSVMQAIINRIDSEIVGDRSFSDEQMVEALEEISSFCDSAVEAKLEELRREDEG